MEETKGYDIQKSLKAVANKSSKNDKYFSATASSLSKRPLAEIHADKDKKTSKVKQAKSLMFVKSKIDTGINKSMLGNTGGKTQSDGLLVKRRDELYGRLSSNALAKFLSQNFTQQTFILKLKKENHKMVEDKGNDFNFTDSGYQQNIPHFVRLNKRPITAKPCEKFGSFT